MAYFKHSATVRRWIWMLLPVFILLIGFGMTWLHAALSEQSETEAAQINFHVRTHEIIAGLERRMAFHEQVLRGIIGLFLSSDEVNREEFHRYIEALQPGQYFPGILGFGYAQLVPADQKAQHVAAMRSQGFPGYDIWPSVHHEIYAAAIYSEPITPFNQRALGFDLFHETVRREALLRARDENRTVMTPKLLFLLDSNPSDHAGVLIFMPHFQTGMVLETLEQRRAALQGWAFLALRPQVLINHYWRSEYADLSQQVAIRVYADIQPNAASLVYESHPGRAPAAAEIIKPMHFLHSQWTISFEPLPSYWAGETSTQRSNIATLLGIGVTLLLALVCQLLLRGHWRMNKALQAAQQANDTLAEQEALLRAIYDSSGLAILLLDTQRHIVYANQCLAQLFQYTADELQGQDYVQFLAPEERAESQRVFKKILADSSLSFTTERKHQRKNTLTEFWYQTTSRAFLDPAGHVTGVVTVIEDITARRTEETAMRLAAAVFEASPGGIMVSDTQQRVVSVNPAFTRITGYEAADVVGQKPTLLFAGLQDQQFYREMRNVIDEEGHWEGEVTNRRKNGQLFPEVLSVSAVRDKNNDVIYYVSIFLDISERRQAEEKIRFLAYHDYLTNLPNRVLFLEKATQALALARRYRRQFGIIFIDLDRFKLINDDYGHDAGDAVLCTIARRLQAAVRQSDTVCRQGGDEFVILLPELESQYGLETLAQKLLTIIEAPCAVEEWLLTVSASIGIATYPEHGDAVDEIVQSADSAMYAAKADPTTHIRFARKRAATEDRPLEEDNEEL